MQNNSHPPYRYVAPTVTRQPKITGHPNPYDALNLHHAEESANRVRDAALSLISMDLSGADKTQLDALRSETNALAARLRAFAVALRVSG